LSVTNHQNVSLLSRSTVFRGYLNNYFNLQVCIRPSVPSVLSVPCVQKLTPVSAVGSQNATKRSLLVSVKSEKYAFWVTFRPIGSMSQDKVKIHALQYSARQSWDAYIKFTPMFHHLPSVGPKQWVLPSTYITLQEKINDT